MLSNNGFAPATSLHEWMSVSALCSKGPRTTASSWIRSSHARTGVEPSIATLTGTVLMNSPTISAIPGSSAGRPDTVAPNTTSRSPL
jgi:hypothetical protein